MLSNECLEGSVASLTDDVGNRNIEIDSLNKALDKSLKEKSRALKMKWYYKSVASRKNESDILETSFESRLSELRDQITILENEKIELEFRLEQFLDGCIKTKENGRYVDDVRAVYQDLVCMGVGVNDVEKVIQSVLNNIAKLKVDSLPKSTFSRYMYLEARRLSQIHVAESLLEKF